MINFFVKILAITLLISCSQIVEFIDSDYHTTFNNDKSLSILFSHNINGETHPCGCRNFPLGGLPQAFGVIKDLSKDKNIFYVDSGDTLFSNPHVPDILRKSTKYNAEKLAEALDLLGLKVFTPGDQDFALGEDFLIKVANKSKFKFLISNSSKSLRIKHEKYIHLKANSNNYFFIGVLSKNLLQQSDRDLFIDSYSAIKEVLAELKTKHSDLKNKKIILLSHSGLSKDRLIAKKFPQIDWIIGAHSQSYMRYSEDVGNTQIVQVLSRNHFIGEINFPTSNNKKTTYKIHETREETKDLIKNNSLIPWLDLYKSNLDKIQLDEQNELIVDQDQDNRMTTYVSCTNCHAAQTDFWQGTAHSLAHITLQNAKAENNTTCIKCHSLGFKKEDGFLHTKKIVSSDKTIDINNYWKDFRANINNIPPVKSMSSTERREISKKWIKLDREKEISHNYANVQCLHCHIQTKEHPFDTSSGALKKNISNTCVECHTQDQSPEWYLKDSKGLATSLNKKYFSKKLKEVSCPKIER